ncbi:MAG TPA: DUF3710 domain-containing protein [Sporichthya sp.]|nr:DUF3710 domain-containing protein [Sporichthya sp.]
MAFRRRKNEDAEVEALEQEELDQTPDVTEVLAQLGPEDGADVGADADDGPAWPTGQIRDREGGPWDAADAPEDKIERVDLGGIQIPIVNGMELRAELAEDQVVAVTLIIERSALQMQPFAAPRTMGIWDDVRAEIAEGIAQSGGTASEDEGRFGTELIAEVGVALPDGTTGMQTARFLGVDGPRWFLRAVITGEASVDAALRRPLEDLLADVVVVRGEDAMAPRDPIPLQLPQEVELGEAGEQFEAAEDDEDEVDDEKRPSVDDFNPFERGPEITEVR